MLDRLKIKNFRCLRSVDVPLRPLTILIGPNDSGKSAFLDSIRYLANDKLKFGPSDHWRWDEGTLVSIKGFVEHGAATRESNQPYAQPEALLNTHVRPIGFYQVPPSGVAMMCPGYTESTEALTLEGNGNRVPALLDHFLRKDRKRFFEVVDALRALVPGIDEVEIATPTPHERRVDLVIEGGVSMPADKASAGVRLLLFFLALAYHPSPPKTILLEEPENGVHPKRLGDVMRLLREITRGEHGQPAQVILTTHSPYLMDHVDIAKDQILVFRRESDGRRIAQPADEERLKAFLDEFMLGEVWFNQSEEGLLGKAT